VTARAIVVGAGLSGALAARLLGRAGWSVRVFDRRGDLRVEPADGSPPGEGRSIGLGISGRARALLTDAGLAEALARISVPMAGRMVHGAKGEETFQPYGPRRSGRRSEAILTPEGPVHSVRRDRLVATLIDAADALPEVTFHFHAKVLEVEPLSGAIRVLGPTGGETVLSADVVIGADGAFSRVRRCLGRAAVLEEERIELPLEYKELAIQASPGLRRDAHHLWPRQGLVLTALPCPDGSFVAVLFLPRAEGRGFASFEGEDAFRAFFEAEFPDVAPFMPNLGRDFTNNPASSLITLRCRPWHAGRVALVGDACHAFVPFSGQGANAAIEDAAALAESVLAHAPDWDAAFERYARRRAPATDAVAELSRVMTPLVLWLAGPLMAERGVE
jgi:kynurenine 3-monooxygenase